MLIISNPTPCALLSMATSFPAHPDAIIRMVVEIEYNPLAGAVMDIMIHGNISRDIRLYCFGLDPNSNVDQAANLIQGLEGISWKAPVTGHTKSAKGKLISHCHIMVQVHVQYCSKIREPSNALVMY